MCRRRFAVMCAFSLVWLQVGAAQAPPDQDARRPEPIDEAIDEITVIAPKSEMAIRAEIIEVEEKMFDIFNSINTNRDFHVICDWEDRDTGNPSTISRLKEWRCQSVYERHIISREFGGVAGRDAIANARALETLTQGPIRRHRAEMQKQMIALAEENPDLANAIYQRAALERDLAEARQREHE